MAKTSYASVEQYLAAQPPEARAALERIRALVRAAVPEAEEQISYQIPTFKLDGAVVLHFAGWTKHVSIYPATDGVAEAFADALAGYETSKGTIRFPLGAPLPEALIADIARFRARLAARPRKKR